MIGAGEPLLPEQATAKKVYHIFHVSEQQSDVDDLEGDYGISYPARIELATLTSC